MAQYRLPDPVLGRAEEILSAAERAGNRQVNRRELLRYLAVGAGAAGLALTPLPAQILRAAAHLLPQQAESVVYAVAPNGIAEAATFRSGLVTINYPSNIPENEIKAFGEWVTGAMMPGVVRFLEEPKYQGRKPSWELPYTIDIEPLNSEAPLAYLRQRRFILKSHTERPSAAHEYAHIATESGFHLLPEGIAEWVGHGEYFDPGNWMRDPHRAIGQSRLIPLKDLLNESSSSSSNSPVAAKLEAQGASFVKWLVTEKGGMKKFMEFFLDGAKTYYQKNFASFPAPIWNYKHFYSKSLEELEIEWLAYLREKYALATP